MARRRVVFDDEFFASLGAQLPSSRSDRDVPSRSDFLAYEVPGLMDALAEDYLAATLTVGSTDSIRVLIQTGRLVRNTVLWCQLVDGVIHVFDADIELFEPDVDD